MAVIEVVGAVRRDPDGFGARPIVRLEGELDLSTDDEVALALAHTIALEEPTLVVDLGAVTFIDASTIGVLLRAEAYLAARSRVLVLRAPSTCARRLLLLCGLQRLIEPPSVRITRDVA